MTENDKKFKIEQKKWIEDLKEILVKMQEIEYLENSPMLFGVGDISFGILQIKEKINDFIKYKKVLPIRAERIKKLNKIKEDWYKKLEKEGKDTWDDYNKRPYTPEQTDYAHSWDE